MSPKILVILYVKSFVLWSPLMFSSRY